MHERSHGKSQIFNVKWGDLTPRSMEYSMVVSVLSPYRTRNDCIVPTSTRSAIEPIARNGERLSGNTTHATNRYTWLPPDTHSLFPVRRGVRVAERSSGRSPSRRLSRNMVVETDPDSDRNRDRIQWSALMTRRPGGPGVS